ncbi:unnamed protein product [Rhodiola kirilowii]
MASISSFTSATPLSGVEYSGKCTTRTPNHVRFRQFKISAAYASVERPRTSVSTSASLYDVLGIQTSASCQEIKQAYRRLARVSHPDVASSGADDFIRINAAYSTLSDPEKRADYDRTMFVRRRPVNSFDMAAASYGYSRAAETTVYSNRRWETDQCW